MVALVLRVVVALVDRVVEGVVVAVMVRLDVWLLVRAALPEVCVAQVEEGRGVDV